MIAKKYLNSIVKNMAMSKKKKKKQTSKEQFTKHSIKNQRLRNMAPSNNGGGGDLVFFGRVRLF